MKSRKECEIKLDTPILLQLNEIQLSEGDTQRLKQCYWDLAQKLITKPHPLKESTFFSSHVGRSKKLFGVGQVGKHCLNLSHHTKLSI